LIGSLWLAKINSEGNMKKIWIALFLLFVLAVDWAALHDILKGEPDPWMEWAFVLTSVALFLAFVYRKLREPRRP
jgi:hypothetical protein